MKERPILFSAPMVRAILDGRKTVTRRVVKPQPDPYTTECESVTFTKPGKGIWLPTTTGRNTHSLSGPAFTCPYGQPGDQLWVRESFRFLRSDELLSVPRLGIRTERGCLWRASAPNDLGPWKPSIHMPRWASRISLEITEVRVQRLQDITEDDAIREGATWRDFGRECGHRGGVWRDVGDCKESFHSQRNGWTMEPPAASAKDCLYSARMAFANLINKINGPETWESNPWVWCVSFEKVKQK